MAQTTIEARLDAELKDAMRQRDADRVACIRQVRAKMQETVNAQGFSGEVDDALYEKVITSYVKQLRRGIEELGEAGGERGESLKARYSSEVAYLEKYLPQMLDEAATRKIVQDTVAALGIAGPSQIGRAMGAIMKEHKGSVEAGLVRRVLEEVLAG